MTLLPAVAAVITVVPGIYVAHEVPLLTEYSYKSAAPCEPPVPALIVALGVEPIQIVVPFAGVAIFNVGLAVGELTGQVTNTTGPVAVQP